MLSGSLIDDSQAICDYICAFYDHLDCKREQSRRQRQDASERPARETGVPAAACECETSPVQAAGCKPMQAAGCEIPVQAAECERERPEPREAGAKTRLESERETRAGDSDRMPDTSAGCWMRERDRSRERPEPRERLGSRVRETRAGNSGRMPARDRRGDGAGGSM
jgi:hypothetical protein